MHCSYIYRMKEHYLSLRTSYTVFILYVIYYISCVVNNLFLVSYLVFVVIIYIYIYIYIFQEQSTTIFSAEYWIKSNWIASKRQQIHSTTISAVGSVSFPCSELLPLLLLLLNACKSRYCNNPKWNRKSCLFFSSTDTYAHKVRTGGQGYTTFYPISFTSLFSLSRNYGIVHS